MATIWRDCPDLMARLEEAQNSPALEHVDVMTFAAMCDTRDDLTRHVENCEQRVRFYVQPRKRRRAAQ